MKYEGIVFKNKFVLKISGMIVFVINFNKKLNGNDFWKCKFFKTVHAEFEFVVSSWLLSASSAKISILENFGNWFDFRNQSIFFIVKLRKLQKHLFI